MSAQAERRPTPTEAFEVLGHETRLAIIEELAKPRRTEWRVAGLPFAELRKAVGVEDAGTFNYHLQALQDHFVGKLDGEYVLRNAGFYLAGAIRAGTYTERIEPRRTETDQECPEHEAAIEAVYEDGFFRLECPEHGMISANALPPGAALGRTMDDLLALADRDTRRMVEKIREGSCPHCWGPMETTVPSTPSPRLAEGETTEVLFARFSCARCGMDAWSPVSIAVLDHPAVVSFYHEHGIDIRKRSTLEISFQDSSTGTVLTEDPIRIAIEFELSGDVLRLVLDDELAVVDTD
ncbi:MULTISPECIES: winged helix-turn-helix domain-containing protein [Halococcus]|uniref:ArsR family transcriptional regulator n=1 Tax=Halococcus salifodinae DSM 8989 TaxID=1227456 RepID=M0N6D0_9EURY|nr:MULTISPECIES: helix-turn-helix domain-containing protein [Halococcus]EMA53426.1 hypothetical protein C450_08937 [Halococcus salifodinae DSM 8989]